MNLLGRPNIIKYASNVNFNHTLTTCVLVNNININLKKRKVMTWKWHAHVLEIQWHYFRKGWRVFIMIFAS